MAGTSEAETDDQQPEKSGGGMMKFVLLALVSAGSSFAMAFMLTPAEKAEAAVCTPAEEHAATAVPLATEDQTYVELGEILITIGNEPATRFVKIKTSIITDKSEANTVKKAEPMLIDAFVSYLRSVELEDFEAAGFYPRLREQLARRSELVLGSNVSGGVLITEFLLR